MPVVRDISTFTWLLLFYCFALFAVSSGLVEGPTVLDMNHVLYESKLYNQTGLVSKFTIRTKDVFVIVGIFLLFVEIYKSAFGGKGAVVETIFSFGVSIAYLVIFLLWKEAHTVEMFMMMLMSFIDSIGGFVIENSTARKDISVT